MPPRRRLSTIGHRIRSTLVDRAARWPAQLRIDAVRLRREGRGNAALAEALETAARIVEDAIPDPD